MSRKRNNELEVLSLYLSNYFGQFYLREISRLASLSLRTTQETANFLVKQKILKSQKHGKNKYFSLNHENVAAKFLLLQAEIYKTLNFLQKHPEIKSFIKEIKGSFLAILFGSFASGSWKFNSDIDLLMAGGKKEELPLHLLPYKTHLINIPEDSFALALEKKEPLLGEIAENHIILNNHSFYLNSRWKQNGR